VSVKHMSIAIHRQARKFDSTNATDITKAPAVSSTGISKHAAAVSIFRSQGDTVLR
jgi:hypothetical protein